MGPAALGGLYPPPRPNHDKSRSHRHRQKYDKDMRAVKFILGHYPFPYPADPAKEKQYWSAIRQAIKDLPSHLRESKLHTTSPGLESNGVVKPERLCDDHKGMNADFVRGIWAWVKDELDHHLGPFLHPIIVEASLTPAQEIKIRQLEPVLQIYHKDFDVAAMTLEGRDPIRPGYIANGIFVDRWDYQQNECPACILARVGSDEKVLFAFYAGMVGLLSENKLGKQSKPKSSRLRWLNYLLRQHEHGEILASEAWDLGEEMRRTYRSYKQLQHSTQQFDFYGRKGRASPDLELRRHNESVLEPSTHPGTSFPSELPENPFADPNDQAEHFQFLDDTASYNPPPNPYQWTGTPPPAPANLYAHRDKAASSIYSPATRGTGRQSYCPSTPTAAFSTPSSSLPEPTYHHPPTSQTSRDNRSNTPYPHIAVPQQDMASHMSLDSYASTIGSEPEPIVPDIQHVPRHHSQDNMSRGPSVRSHRAEADNASLAPSAHPSLMPQPLRSHERLNRDGNVQEIPAAQPRSMYSGMGRPAYVEDADDESEDGYESEGPETPRTAERGVTGGRGTTGVSRASVQTNGTQWNFF